MAIFVGKEAIEQAPVGSLVAMAYQHDENYNNLGITQQWGFETCEEFWEFWRGTDDSVFAIDGCVCLGDDDDDE